VGSLGIPFWPFLVFRRCWRRGPVNRAKGCLAAPTIVAIVKLLLNKSSTKSSDVLLTQNLKVVVSKGSKIARSKAQSSKSIAYKVV
jgi:hypothetical protein